MVRWYINKWTDYSRAIKLLSYIFYHVHRQWMGFAQQKGYDKVHDIKTVSYFWKICWHSIASILVSYINMVQIHVKTNFWPVTKQLFENNRNWTRITHDITNVYLINDIIDSFTEFHFDKDLHVWFEDEREIIPPIPMNFYKDSFENSFFEQTNMLMNLLLYI